MSNYRYKRIIGFLLSILLFTGCDFTRNPIENELVAQESDFTNEDSMITEQDDLADDAFNLLISNINLRLDAIADSIKEIARNQDVIEVLLKGEEDYNSIFDMIRDREEVIVPLIYENMVKNSSIHRIYFLTKEGDLILDSATDESDILEVSPNDSDEFIFRPYINKEGDMVIFQVALKNMMNGEYVFVVYEVNKADLLVDVYQTQQGLADKYLIEVLDVEGINLTDPYDMDKYEMINCKKNSYDWKISMLLAADE